MNKRIGSIFSRRRFLTLAWRGLLALSGGITLGGLLRFFSYQTGPKRKTQFELGSLDAFPPGSMKTIAEAQAIVVHSPEGLYALSAVCPHLGCQIEVTDQGLVCPCHTSRFDLQGQRTEGPAQGGLRRLRLEFDADQQIILFVDPA